MANKLKEMHQLIAEERYREAREILETESDIDPAVAQKWLTWLEDLHRQERREAGLQIESKKQPQVQAEPPIGNVLATVNVTVLTVLSLILSVQVLQTPNMAVQSAFLFFALLAGIFGWQKVTAKFLNEHHQETGVGIALFIFFSLVFGAKLPFQYFYDVPLRYVVAAFLLIYPILAWGGWHLGMGLGKILRQRLIEVRIKD